MLKDKFNYIPFDDKWFESVSTYSVFMLTKEFYEKFTSYEFLLIYQLDAWVFRNELEYWCAQGYDYLGAPWFKDATTMYSKAGNGGFSLRNVRACLDAIDCGVHRTFASAFKRHKKKHLISNTLHFPVVIASCLFDKLWPEQLPKCRKTKTLFGHMTQI